MHEVESHLIRDLIHVFDRLILEHADDERTLAREQAVERRRAFARTMPQLPASYRGSAAAGAVLLDVAHRLADGSRDLCGLFD